MKIRDIKRNWGTLYGNFGAFARNERILELSAGDNRKLKRTYPRKLLARADRHANPGLDVVMDNRKGFPFRKDAFDGVYLGAGLCTCCGPKKMCAGIPMTEKGARHLLDEVARVVDWKNPNARAVLTGDYHKGLEGSALIKFWKRMVCRTSFEAPVVADVVRNRRGGHFIGLILRAAKPKRSTTTKD